MSSTHRFQVCVLGGAGHIGLPLAIVCATRGMPTLIFDKNVQAMEQIKRGEMPFAEDGAESLLRDALASNALHFTSSIADLAGIEFIVITIGTPVDEFLNPETRQLQECLDSLAAVLTDGQTLIIRSTVAPGITAWIDDYLRAKGKRVHVAFCPERVVQGRGIIEMQSLPQIVSGQTPEAVAKAESLFSRIAPSLVRMQTKEAEFGKLFCNVYRYTQFAIANQFYMLAAQAGLDYSSILAGLRQDYPRIRDLPGAGFAAGPCLFKDTMQLVAFSKNQFSLGTHAMMTNEGLPLFLVDEMERQWDLRNMTVGLLGMAFKANSDDARSSLSYKLKKILRTRSKEILTTDPFVKDPELTPLDDVITKSDILILCTPHALYRTANVRGKPVVDVWNHLGNGALVPGPAS